MVARHPGKYIELKVFSNESTIQYARAIRNVDNTPVILKILTGDRPDLRDIQSLKNENEMKNLLPRNAALVPLAFELFEGRNTLVLEDFPESSFILNDWDYSSPNFIEHFLTIAVRTAQALGEVHAANIIHGNIKPQNIFISLTSYVVKFTGFGGTVSLEFMSPEQAGRMNRPIDQRTDLYSLGLVFYQILTEELPFRAKDPLEWVHSHIAKPHVPAHVVRPEIPEMISLIVERLLEKNPDDRYQSAFGLEKDLKKCLMTLKKTGQISSFELGVEDLSSQFKIPLKLYGRENERRSLLEAFVATLKSGVPTVMFVSGDSGVGKSTLFGLLHDPVMQEHGYFIYGNFGVLKQNAPYAPLVRAFGDLVDQILSEDESRLRYWRQEIQEAVGINGQILVDMVPKIKTVIGDQSPLVELPLLETENRFNFVVLQFFKVFSKKAHPLTLVLDDLQRADQATLKLLEYVLTHRDLQYFFLVGGYRQGEVTSSHPLSVVMSHLKKAKVRINEIRLGPLQLPEVTQLVADTLHDTSKNVLPLAALVFEKSGGNPFFTSRFLLTLYQEGLITYDSKIARWIWDISQIRAQRFTDNVADFVVKRVERLSNETGKILKIASAMLGAFNSQSIGRVLGLTEDTINAGLTDAFEQGFLIHSTDDFYEFSHDRVTEAVYSLIPKEDCAKIHLQIARALVSRAESALVKENIFDLASQFRLGISEVTDRNERLQVARIFLSAGIRARESAAYLAALEYIDSGIFILDVKHWEDQPDLSFEIFYEKAQIEFLLTNLVITEELTELLLKKIKHRLQKLSVYFLKLELHMFQLDHVKTLEITQSALMLFGIKLPISPDLKEARRALEETFSTLGDRSIAELAALPPMIDPERQIAMKILTTFSRLSWATNVNLPPVICLQMIKMCIDFGNPTSAPTVYSFFGLVLSSVFERYKEADEYGMLAYQLALKMNNASEIANSCFYYGTLTSFWKHPLSFSLKLSLQGLENAARASDIALVSVLTVQILYISLVEGASLQTIDDEVEKGIQFLEASKFLSYMPILIGLKGLIRSLQGKDLDLKDYEKDLEKNSSPVSRMYYVFQLQKYFFFGNYNEAIVCASRYASLVIPGRPSLMIPEYHYYTALSLTALYLKASTGERQAYEIALRNHQSRLSKFSENNPENYRNKYLLVSAEIARIKKEIPKAMHLYEEAIQSARNDGFIQNESIAHELAGRFYLEQGLESIAEVFLKNAYYGYSRWGATGKLVELELMYSKLKVNVVPDKNSSYATSQQLDLMSTVKASQAISTDLIFNKLLERLMEITIESAGAKKGYLILVDDDRLIVEARGTSDKKIVGSESFLPISIDHENDIPKSVIHYVKRTMEKIILDDATVKNNFSTDEYIVKNKPRSLLALPVVRQGGLVGVLYLENNAVPFAFSSDKVVVLEVLATQAAISIQNAQLFLRANEAVKMREEFIALASHELKTPLTPLKIGVQTLKRLYSMEKDLEKSRPLITKIIETSEQSVIRFESLVAHMLDVSQLGSSDIDLKTEELNLTALVHEISKKFSTAPTSSKKGSLVRFHGPHEIIGFWDRTRLTQAVSHLISNAMKFGEEKPIVVSVLPVDNTAHISVQDHGIGISKQDQVRIFERFERAVSIKNFGGFGLGLYFTKRIIEAHGGHIELQSEPHKGSSFTVVLPILKSGQKVRSD